MFSKNIYIESSLVTPIRIHVCQSSHLTFILFESIKLSLDWFLSNSWLYFCFLFAFDILKRHGEEEGMEEEERGGIDACVSSHNLSLNDTHLYLFICLKNKAKDQRLLGCCIGIIIKWSAFWLTSSHSRAAIISVGESKRYVRTKECKRFRNILLSGRTKQMIQWSLIAFSVRVRWTLNEAAE